MGPRLVRLRWVITSDLPRPRRRGHTMHVCMRIDRFRVPTWSRGNYAWWRVHLNAAATRQIATLTSLLLDGIHVH